MAANPKKRVASFARWPSFDEEQVAAVAEVLRTGAVNYWTGHQGVKFESEYAASCGVGYAIAVANGSVGLELALYSLCFEPGDEVIVTPRSFIASASCAVLRGLTPVFVDVDRDSQNISPDSVRRAITSRTRAIIAVHLAGWPAQMDVLAGVARDYGLKIIEDCAQANGAKFQDKPVGAWGDIGVFSFCQDKIMTTGGEGGMLVTNDRQAWERAWTYKDHGKRFELTRAWGGTSQAFRWVHEDFGTNWRLTEMQAALGRIQLSRLPNWLRVRRRNASILSEGFARIPALRVTVPSQDVFHAYYKYYAFARPELLKTAWTRDRIVEEINWRGVPCFVGSCSEIYLEKAFDTTSLRPQSHLPVARELGDTSLQFQVHPTLNEQNMNDTCDVVSEVFAEASR